MIKKNIIKKYEILFFLFFVFFVFLLFFSLEERIKASTQGQCPYTFSPAFCNNCQSGDLHENCYGNLDVESMCNLCVLLVESEGECVWERIPWPGRGIRRISRDCPDDSPCLPPNFPPSTGGATTTTGCFRIEEQEMEKVYLRPSVYTDAFCDMCQGIENEEREYECDSLESCYLNPEYRTLVHSPTGAIRKTENEIYYPSEIKHFCDNCSLEKSIGDGECTWKWYYERKLETKNGALLASYDKYALGIASSHTCNTSEGYFCQRPDIYFPAFEEYYYIKRFPKTYRVLDPEKPLIWSNQEGPFDGHIDFGYPKKFRQDFEQTTACIRYKSLCEYNSVSDLCEDYSFVDYSQDYFGLTASNVSPIFTLGTSPAWIYEDIDPATTTDIVLSTFDRYISLDPHFPWNWRESIRRNFAGIGNFSRKAICEPYLNYGERWLNAICGRDL